VSGVATEVLCDDCEGGPERCAREGHLQTWPLEGVDPNVAMFVCARCNETFKLQRCAACGAVLGPPGACVHEPPPAGPAPGD
jgi:hypothetical protein